MSRSAQPQKENLVWLKDQGVTAVFNFRTMYYAPDVNFDEKTEVEKLGMKYHSIPSITELPTDENIKRFLSETDEVILHNGKAHIHCKAGQDRTGMYSYIYKTVKGIGDRKSNEQEMLSMGHNTQRYPNLLNWINNYLDNLLTLK